MDHLPNPVVWRSGAATLLLSLLLFSIAAGVWVWQYPVDVYEIDAQGYATFVSGSPSAEFIGFLTFLGLSAVLGAIVAAFGYKQGLRTFRGMLFIGALLSISAWWMLAVGERIAALMYAVPQAVLDRTAAAGELVTVATMPQPSVGLLAAPLAGCIVYWMLQILEA